MIDFALDQFGMLARDVRRPVGEIADVQASLSLRHLAEREAFAAGLADLTPNPIASSSMKIGDFRSPLMAAFRK